MQPKSSLKMPIGTVPFQVLHIPVASQCCGEDDIPPHMACKGLVGLTSPCSSHTAF